MISSSNGSTFSVPAATSFSTTTSGKIVTRSESRSSCRIDGRERLHLEQRLGRSDAAPQEAVVVGDARNRAGDGQYPLRRDEMLDGQLFLPRERMCGAHDDGGRELRERLRS